MRGFLIKLFIGIVGLIILWKFGSIDLAVLSRAADRPGLLILAFLCLLVTVPMAAFRWLMLLRGLQFGPSFIWALNTTFITLFFNTFLPGAYGGDLVRLAMAYRAVGHSLNRLTFSVIVDRLSGLVALLLLGLVTLPVLPGGYADRLAWVSAIAVLGLAAGIVLAITAGDFVARLCAKLPAPVGPVLAHIARESVGALRAYLARPALLASSVAISVVQYALVLVALYALGHAMRFDGLSWSGYVIAGSWSLVANGLPVTPGGIGIGEAAFAHVASLLATGSSQQAGFGTIFLAERVLAIALGMIAVVPWLLYRGDLRQGIAAVKASEDADEHAVPAPR